MIDRTEMLIRWNQRGHGTLDDEKNKELKERVLRELEPKYTFPCYNDWHKKMNTFWRKEYRLVNIPLDEREIKIIKKQLKMTKQNEGMWEDLPYEPFFGCNLRCDECATCETRWKFGEQCRECKKKIRNLINSVCHTINDTSYLLCHTCAASKVRRNTKHKKKSREKLC